MKYLSLFIAFTFISFQAQGAETPDWVKNFGKSASFPDAFYITGFGISKASNDDDKADARTRATENARANLVQKISVKVQNTITSRKEENNTEYLEHVNSFTQSTSSLEIQGVEMQSYFNNGDNMYYAFAYVKKEKLYSLYAAKAEELMKEIHQRIESGQRDVENNLRNIAIEKYLGCFPLFTKLAETKSIMMVTQMMDTSIHFTSEKNEASIHDAIDKLIQKPVNDANDIAWFLCYYLKEQLPNKKISITVTPFTYQDTKMGSSFSRYFQQAMESQIVSAAKWEVSQERGEYIVTGTYWEQTDGIKFTAVLKTIAHNTIVATAEKIVPHEILKKTNLALKPQNFEQAFSDLKQFRKDEIIDGGLHLETWTNKGKENLLFTKGEKMSVYVRVNIPSYIRFIYHLATGKRALLLENYYIDASKVNQVVEIPGPFECDEPFGAEVLQVFARTEQFEPVATTMLEGYPILKEDLPQVVAQTRGMKKVKSSTMQAEQRVVLTTMEK